MEPDILATTLVWHCFGALVALGAVLLPAREYAEELIRIGVLSFLTGAAAYAGELGLKAIQLYAEKINEAGG